MAVKDVKNILREFELISCHLAPFMPGDERRAGAKRATGMILYNALLKRLGHDVNGFDASKNIPDTIYSQIARRIDTLLDNSDDFKGTALFLLDHSASSISGEDKKDSGVFYTPYAVASYICKASIEGNLLEYFNEKYGISHNSFDGLLKDCDNGRLNEIFCRLKNLRLLDNCCGTGIFLEAAVEELYKTIFKVIIILEIEDDIDIAGLKKNIVNNNIYGADIDPYSIKIAEIRLMSLFHACNGLKINLACANTIFTGIGGERNIDGIEIKGWKDIFPGTDGKFDIIAGNPPYMRLKSMFSGVKQADRAEMKKGLAGMIKKSGMYIRQEGNINLYKLFIEKDLELINKKGSIGLIIPSSFLTEISSRKLRSHIFEKFYLNEVIEIPERSRIFGKVNQATSIIILHGSSSGHDSFKLRTGVDAESLASGKTDSITIGYDELKEITDGRMEIPLFTKPSMEWDIIRAMKKFSPFSGDASHPAVGEISVGNVDETMDKAYISDDPSDDIFVKGIHLKEYEVDLSPPGKKPRWVKKNKLLGDKPWVLNVISKPRIIGRNTQNKSCSRRLKFALLPGGYVCSNSIKQVIMTDINVDPGYMLALLNSAVLNYYLEVFCSQNNIRNYIIESMPVPRAGKEVQDIFKAAAFHIMNSKGSAKEFIDRRIMDPMAFELYFLRTDDNSLISLVGNRVRNGGLVLQDIMSDDKIIEKIEAIEQHPYFKHIQKVAYKKP
jgi:Alw26I/Eco31I/Esp3I family type II restriction m6 adenine DNA methyltransferase